MLSQITGYGCEGCDVNGFTWKEVEEQSPYEVDPTVYWTLSGLGKQGDGRYLFFLNRVIVLGRNH